MLSNEGNNSTFISSWFKLYIMPMYKAQFDLEWDRLMQYMNSFILEYSMIK